MQTPINRDSVYVPSGDVVCRVIEGELIIVPLTGEVAGLEEMDALFTLNESGRDIWDRLDGRRSLKDVIDDLMVEFDASDGQIEADVLGLAGELVNRKMLVEVKPAPAE